MSRDPDTRFRAARAFDAAPSEWLIALFESPPPDADVVVVAPDVDEAGIELDLQRPARTIAAVERQLGRDRPGTVLAVSAASGGVGCTSVALHLAAFLSVEGPALYLEGSTRCGGRYRLGLDDGGPDWGQLEEVESIEEVALPVAGGFRALLAPRSGSSLPAEVLERCAQHVRMVVVDMGDAAVQCAQGKERGPSLVVLSPTIPSARRAADLVSGSENVVLISNRVGPGSEASDAMLADVLGRRITVALPCSPSLRDAEDKGRLLGRDASTWSRRVARLADRLRA